jgi:hypothetical protein
MAAINLSNVFYGVDTLLNGLLSRYVSLQFIGFDQSDDNKPYYLLDAPLTKGFRHKEKKLPVTGQVVETLQIVTDSDEVKNLLLNKQVKMFELTNEDGDFVRFDLKAKAEPHPPKYEWVYDITPNKQERTVIT